MYDDLQQQNMASYIKRQNLILASRNELQQADVSVLTLPHHLNLYQQMPVDLLYFASKFGQGIFL